MERERLNLGMDERKRIKILERLQSGDMMPAEAAEGLGITTRHLRNIRKKYAEEGDRGVIHGNRGRKPVHAVREEVRDKVVALYEEKYGDCNFTHFSELLSEREEIFLSVSSVSRILKSEGHKSKKQKRRRPRKHRPRDRRSQEGMLWQTDATPYAWLGCEYGPFALHAIIDDASGIVTGAVFMKHECAKGYAIAMMSAIREYGIPLALYSDKHTIFRSPKEPLSLDQELAGETIPLSNFGKALAELRITHIKANTPQAKGRVERLWGTLQDRLSVELRLLGIKSIEEANAALPSLLAKHNHRYAVVPAAAEKAYMPLDEKIHLEHVFTLRETRKLSNASISYKCETYALTGTDFIDDTTVEVRETHSGEVLIWHNGCAHALKKIDKRPRRQGEDAVPKKEKSPYKPPANHPWRKSARGTSLQHAIA